ncbi:hypothetical protein HHI36_005049 [Cryptolaemus montrouzieri]|uniref:Uncharacterized protein n=1 Tax=Cryptolaemus montrouzieri TaxID=559131 RepID=A0ABD2NTZ9_9CUCU
MAEMMKKIGSQVNEHISAAVTLCEIQGTMLIPEYVNAKSHNAPPWQVRLEGKIVNQRKKIGHLHTYLNFADPSRKLLRYVRLIASEFRMRTKDPNFNNRIAVICDTMKHKIKALVNRSRRYKERVKRYKNNSLFYKNTKLFYRTLEQSDTAEGAPPSPNDVRTFWSGIWENDISHDENAFWMDEVESKIPKHNMPDITITAEDISGTQFHTSQFLVEVFQKHS